jgi:malate synthase
MDTVKVLPTGMSITAPMKPEYAQVLTPAALEFAAKLCRQFEHTRQALLAKRAERQKEFDAGKLPDFLPETANIRNSEWTVAPIPADLQDRRVEITGPVDRKMVINALNSGASTYMADFEDSNTPTWSNNIEGQINLMDAIRRTITFQQGEKSYKLNDKTAVLIVRPRGWHLDEKHVLIDGKPVSGAIFDFALYAFHNAKELLARGSGPYFYLPKMESHLEARLWNDIFTTAEKDLGIPHGSCKGTVLIEVILAAFEMDEILWELKDHCVGLNIGRWDYIFSAIKKLRVNKDFCLADRAAVTMTSPFLRAYALSLVKTCHRRNASAMGGMAAQIPIKNDAAANEAAMAKVKADKLREATDGCDGTWVAHPGLVPIAKAVFDEHMPAPNQIARKRDDVNYSAKDLLDFKPETPITEAGLRNNLQVGIQYIGSWLAGNGCVPIFNLMEDAATAEISRSQVWQWIRSPKGVLDDGRKVTKEMVSTLVADELKKTPGIVGDAAYASGKYVEAAAMLEKLILDDQYEEFLTLPAYRAIE